MTAAESFTPQLLRALRKVTVNKTQAESDATVSTPSFLVSQELGEEGPQEGNRAVTVDDHMQRGATCSDQAVQL